ncbi:hypothetical protein DFJ73DRAFT_792773 [Zopfochytrium polystomum]|nr:hypothetical protein DFJ73DRAFT_792773 [Zopfochytrium polystomum]
MLTLEQLPLAPPAQQPPPPAADAGAESSHRHQDDHHHNHNHNCCWDPVVAALLAGALLSRASPLRVLGRDRDALAMLLRAHRQRNVLPYVDWSCRGYFQGVGRLGLGGEERRTWESDEDDDDDEEEEDEDEDGGDDEDGEDESDDAEYQNDDGEDDDDEEAEEDEDDDDEDDVPGDDAVDGATSVDGARPTDSTASKDDHERVEEANLATPQNNPRHTYGECCGSELRWFYNLDYVDFRREHAAEVRKEAARQWQEFEEHVLKVGKLSPAEWERLKLEVGDDPERRCHALIADGLGPELVEPFHVNMLPFVMGHDCTLPLKCRRYAGLIDLCLLHCPDELGQVGYLTVHEGFVEPGRSQRRPGLHIESPGFVEALNDRLVATGGGGDGQSLLLQKMERWGVGVGSDVLNIRGGLFQASSVSGTCRVWDCVIRDHAAVVGPHGSVEHLRGALCRGPPAHLADLPVPRARQRGKKRKPTSGVENSAARPSFAGGGARNGVTLPAHEIAWMTDRTPHESLPPPVGETGEGGKPVVFRQYFRLVTSAVTVWYAAHSTRNDECGVAPPTPDVRIVEGDKLRAVGERRRAADEPLAFL